VVLADAVGVAPGRNSSVACGVAGRQGGLRVCLDLDPVNGSESLARAAWWVRAALVGRFQGAFLGLKAASTL
jgi:hypothetical protein